jgi:hypothetical protein
MSRRFFAFGCSYTSYFFPTWADLVGSNFDEYYNYGRPGASNRYIFSAVTEANIIHKFTKDDVIFIQWSGIERSDKFINNEWKLQLHRHARYIEWVYFKDKLLETMNYMTILKDWFNTLDISYKFLILNNIDSDYDSFVNEDCIELKDFYKDTADILYPGFHNTLVDNRDRPTTIAGREIRDGHHFPWEHHDYVEKFFPEYLPKIGDLQKKLIEVYKTSINPNLNEMDQNNKFRQATWPIAIQGTMVAHNKHPAIRILKK